MKFRIRIGIFIALVLLARPVGAAPRAVENYCRKRYPTYKVRVVKMDDPRIMRRKGKRVVYVERVVSRSMGGKRGKIAGKWTIAYNKRVRKGKRVVSYCIWNPRNNYCDDVVAVVDNRIIR